MLEVGVGDPKRIARMVGCLGLVGIVTGAFDIGYVHNALFVDGNAAASVAHLAAHQTLFRAGFAAHLVLLLSNVPAEILMFLLMRRVSLPLAALAMACGLIGTSIESAAMLAAYVPVQLALDGNTLGALTPAQLQTFGYFAMQLQNAGLLLSFLFYGLDEIVGGLLIFRSGFLPRVLGILLSVAGVCYLLQGFLGLVAPSLDAHLFPYILFPCLPGEGSIALWLAIVGLNVAKWRACPALPEIA
jgi:hypothetical protein